MTSKFVSFLDDVGKDFKKGLSKLAPFMVEATTLAQDAEPEVAALDPALGAIFKTVVSTVSEVEQKFAALGQQSGSGEQKLAAALTILEPVVSQSFAAAGKASDTGTVTNYINAVVGFLNAIPASGTATAPAATAS